MKSRTSTLLAAMTLFVSLAITVQISAQATPSKIIIFNAPGAGKNAGQGTIPYGINVSGTIAGEEVDDVSVYHGFVRTRGGKITNFDAPGAGKHPGYGTSAVGINSSGAITGYDVEHERRVSRLPTGRWQNHTVRRSGRGNGLLTGYPSHEHQ